MIGKTLWCDVREMLLEGSKGRVNGDMIKRVKGYLEQPNKKNEFLDNEHNFVE